MSTMTATEAKNKFGQLLEMAQREPVRIQKNGRDVGVMLSPEEYAAYQSSSDDKVNPLVKTLHAESVQRYGKVYEVLAK